MTYYILQQDKDTPATIRPTQQEAELPPTHAILFSEQELKALLDAFCIAKNINEELIADHALTTDERTAVMDRDGILIDDLFATQNAYKALVAEKEQSTTEY